MKKLVLLLPALAAVAACDAVDYSPSHTQRDVYRSLEECVIDWGDEQLCLKAQQEATARAAAQNAGSGSGGYHSSSPVVIWHGPEYYGSNRYGYHNGQMIRPRAQNSFTTQQQPTSTQFKQNYNNSVRQASAGQSPGKSASGSSTSSAGKTTGGFGRGGSFASGSGS